MGPLAIAGIQTAISALPMFIGENSMFSGKRRRASKLRESTFQKSQNYQLPSEFEETYKSAVQQQNVGIPSAALGLYNQSMARNLRSNLSALGSRRSLLGGIGQVAQSGQDASLKLAGMQSDAIQQGRRYADQLRMQLGGMKQSEEIRKMDEAAQFAGVLKQEADAAMSASLEGIGSALGNAMYGETQMSEGAAGLRAAKQGARQTGRTARAGIKSSKGM